MCVWACTEVLAQPEFVLPRYMKLKLPVSKGVCERKPISAVSCQTRPSFVQKKSKAFSRVFTYAFVLFDVYLTRSLDIGNQCYKSEFVKATWRPPPTDTTLPSSRETSYLCAVSGYSFHCGVFPMWWFIKYLWLVSEREGDRRVFILLCMWPIRELHIWHKRVELCSIDLHFWQPSELLSKHTLDGDWAVEKNPKQNKRTTRICDTFILKI